MRYKSCWVPASLRACNKSDSLGESWTKPHMPAVGHMPPRQVCTATPNMLIGLQRSQTNTKSKKILAGQNFWVGAASLCGESRTWDTLKC